MARYAFISDIHGNLFALEVVLQEIERLGVDGIICLGDIVGYGPHPAECLDIIADRTDFCIQGNHDLAVIDDTEIKRFNSTAASAIEFTKTRLHPRHLSQIAEMPAMGFLDQVTVSHGSPVVDGPTDYIHDQHIAALAYGGFDNFCLFVGHTHIPIAFGTPEVGYAMVDAKDIRVALLPPRLPLRLDPGYRYIINPGSVGQPRDGNPESSFGILDTGTCSFAVYRIPYDVDAAHKAILEAGLPNFLAQRLRVGA
ncbi:MAG: metallophosphoesterase family protein [Planctomycetes bacterium]|nr:metallophosphoesterase family protein [Planctomycetota bacterium]